MLFNLCKDDLLINHWNVWVNSALIIMDKKIFFLFVHLLLRIEMNQQDWVDLTSEQLLFLIKIKVKLVGLEYVR